MKLVTLLFGITLANIPSTKECFGGKDLSITEIIILSLKRSPFLSFKLINFKTK
jgi:hypothetical protein